MFDTLKFRDRATLAKWLPFVHNTRTVSQDTFQFAYDGEDVRNGAMDVYELAPALMSVGDLIREANRFLNQDRAEVSVKVQADFTSGSFDVALLLDQGIVEQARQVLFGASIVDAGGLISLVFGLTKEHKEITGLAVYGLFQLYKLLKGEKPKPGSLTIETNVGTLVYEHHEYHIDPTTAHMYMNDALRAATDRVLRPIAKEGLDKLEVRKNEQSIEVVKSDLPPRVIAMEKRHVESQEILTDTREALLRVVTANFEKGKWTFSDGTARFTATLNDPNFRDKMDKHEEGFYKGDVLRVLLRTEQSIKSDGKFQSTYTIEEVLDHISTGRQSRLI